VVEVHISNVFGREDFRKISHISAKSVGVISGLGMKGYELAVSYFVK
jgi:3-dehydroquinate dehydratase-2